MSDARISELVKIDGDVSELFESLDAPACDYDTGVALDPEAGACGPTADAVIYGISQPCGHGHFLCYAHALYWVELSPATKDVICVTCDQPVAFVEWRDL